MGQRPLDRNYTIAATTSAGPSGREQIELPDRRHIDIQPHKACGHGVELLAVDRAEDLAAMDTLRTSRRLLGLQLETRSPARGGGPDCRS